MTQLFFKAANFTSNRATVQLQKVEPLMQVLENDAYGHWIFGENSSSLTDKVNAKSLILQNTASVLPSYTNSSVTISTALGNALQTDLIDSAAQNFTLCAVVKCNTTALSVLLGNLVPSSDASSSGFGAFASSGKCYLTAKPTAAAAASSNGISSLTTTQNIAQTSNFFIAVSIDKSTKKGVLYITQNSVESNGESSFTGTYESSSKKIAIGNNAYTTSITASNTATFSEAIIYDKALTLEQIKSVAKRSRERMSDRNIYF